MKRQATNGGRKNRERPGNLREQIDPLMCKAYEDAALEANGTMFPTPRAKESGDYQYSRGDHDRKTLTLSGMIRMFPTPTTRDYKSANLNPKSKRFQKSTELNTAVKMYPTPTAREYKGARSTDALARAGRKVSNSLCDTVAAMFPTPTTGAGLCGGTGNYQQLQRLKESGVINEDKRRNMAQGNGGQLNPDWVEWLMGFPAGWTNITAEPSPAEMQSDWWGIEPDVPHVAVGVKNRVDRLKALGNAVVPYQAYPIFKAIAQLEAERNHT